MAVATNIIARRWFEKTNGNTYHTVELVLDNGITIKSPRAYGYDEQWKSTARDLMARNGVSYFWSSGNYEVHDVKRRKDL